MFIIACWCFLMSLIFPCLATTDPHWPSEALISNNHFAVTLMKSLNTNNPTKNQALSPWSIYLGLAMLSVGAKGRTYDEIAKLLKWKKYRNNIDFMGYEMSMLIPPTTSDQRIVLSVASRLWVDHSISVRSAFSDILRQDYYAEVGYAAFRWYPTSSIQTINSWVSDKTNGKITKLLNHLSQEAKLVLTNAIFFQDNWMHPFPTLNTRPLNFKINGRVKRKVPMMKVKGTFQVYRSIEEGCRILSLPYSNNQRDMIIIVPTSSNSVSNVLRNLSEEGVLDKLLSKLHEEKNMYVYLPRFQLNSKYNLKNILQRMGLRSAFDASADFSGISATEGSLQVSNVVHEADITVDEKGTTATAATGVIIESRVLTFTFLVNRPFIFMIRDHATGLYIFSGIVNDPRKR